MSALLYTTCLQVNHELSVPAVTVMLLAVGSYVVATCCQLLLEGKLNSQTMFVLKTAGTMITIAMFFLVSAATQQ